MVRVFPIYGPSGSLLAQVLVHQWSTDSSNPLKLGVKVAERTGLEPATSGVTGRRSNQLNYRSAFSGAKARDLRPDWQI